MNNSFTKDIHCAGCPPSSLRIACCENNEKTLLHSNHRENKVTFIVQ